MNAQVLLYSTYNANKEWFRSPADGGEAPSFSFGEMGITDLSHPTDFDAFDVNVICLDDTRFWTNREGNSTSTVDSLSDLDSLACLSSSTKSIVVIALPSKNISFSYRKSRSSSDPLGKLPIKDMLDDVMHVARHTAGMRSIGASLVFASGVTVIDNTELSSDFYFNTNWGDIVTRTIASSPKPTSVRFGDVIFTSLPILRSEDAFLAFLGVLFPPEDDGDDAPDWFGDLPPMFDDAELNDEVARQNEIIDEASECIAESERKLDANRALKSILYTNGERLEGVVRQIIGELLDWDQDTFEDVGTSDFIVEYGSVYFVGEIKGENSNVTNSHLSQLTLNCDLDVEAGYVPEGCELHKLLIANTFRKKPLAERPSVDDKQIALAREKHECLIVTTPVLLRLLEAVRAGEITNARAVELLLQTGILLESDIC